MFLLKAELGLGHMMGSSVWDFAACERSILRSAQPLPDDVLDFLTLQRFMSQ